MSEEEQNIASEYTALKEKIKKHKADFDKLDKQIGELEQVYMSTAINTGVVVKQLDELGKLAGAFNRKAQAMNVLYCCCEVLRVKHPDAIDGVGAAFWDADQVKVIKEVMKENFQLLRKNDEGNS